MNKTEKRAKDRHDLSLWVQKPKRPVDTYTLSDMVAIPDFDAGAMENWGLITYRESLLLANNGSSSSTSRQKLVEVMAHELAHQVWFVPYEKS